KQVDRKASASPTHRSSEPDPAGVTGRTGGAGSGPRAGCGSGVGLVRVAVGRVVVGIDAVGGVGAGLAGRVGGVVVIGRARLLVPPLGGDVVVRQAGDQVRHLDSSWSVDRRP